MMNTTVLPAFALDDQHHSDEIAKCLVDLHGTCLVLPFHREGLPYFTLLVISIVLFVIQFLRIAAREMNSPNPPNDVSEWHLLLGRFGVICFTLATALDHLRLACGAWDASWPSYILTASDATVANELWTQHGYGGTTLQTFLWWYCCFLQLVMLPVALFSVSYIYIKARLRLRIGLHNTRLKYYFLLSGVVVLFFLMLGLIAFCLGPIQMPLQVVRVTGLWSLTTTSTLMTNVATATLLAWHGSLIVLAMSLWYLEGPSKRLPNMLFILIVGTSFLMSCDPLVHEARTNTGASLTGLSPLVTKFLLQLTIGSQMWADITHNPDDYGRLNDDMYRMVTVATLRQPLLAATNAHDDDHVDDEIEHSQRGDGARDDIEQGDGEPSEIEESQ